MSVAARGAQETGGTPRRGGRALLSLGRLDCFLTCTPSSLARSFQKSRSRRFHSVWTSFVIPFLQNTEIGEKNSNTGWASG